MKFLKKTMNCIKAVILFWTCIIAFHASVTAHVFDDFPSERGHHFDDWDISAIKVNSCGGILKSIDIHYEFIRNARTKYLFDMYNYTNFKFDVRGPRVKTFTYDTSPCDEGMKHNLQTIGILPGKNNDS
ncbi:unnamed protein product [Macrosiphum euphorbiae]|uniref:Uncharacterized protein n=1 Tax=Macrosiphum euphorbiae TaxID=13131 RepID=A0AAV0WK21_9HEMI|nr:unnamed protein product [Macrosiphum euphorbiae]